MIGPFFRTPLLIVALAMCVMASVGCESQPVADDSHVNQLAPPPPPPQQTPQQRPTQRQVASNAPSQRYTPPAVSTGGVPRAWLPTARPNAWKYIVVHHSDTPKGSAAAFDRAHKARGWDGLGYHFVIGNGTDTPDGYVEVGFRWPIQRSGAHAGVREFNDFGIGVCLVGNFDIDRPTTQQFQSLAKLVGYLMRTYHIPAERVIGHRDAKHTDCPGRNMDLAALRRLATQYAGAPTIDYPRTAIPRTGP